MLAMDWNSLVTQYNAKYGADLCEEDLPAKSNFEEFEERLAEVNFEAERLSEVVSQEEAEVQRRAKPDPARQYSMHLDGRLTLQTRRRFPSTEPRDIEQLRAKYTVMENLWLLKQMRQPGRSIYREISEDPLERTSTSRKKWTTNYFPNRQRWQEQKRFHPARRQQRQQLWTSRFWSAHAVWTKGVQGSLFHPSEKQFCWNFQRRQCADPKVCNRRHVCIGCGAEGKPQNDCFCSQSKLN